MTDSLLFRRPIVVWDVALSIALLAIGGVFVVTSAVVDLITTAFIGSCPVRTCNAGDAVASLGISWFAMFLIFIVGAIVTVLALARRRLGWWIALAAVVVMVAVWIVGFVFYSHAVSHEVAGLGGLAALGTTLA
jgi:hypothetical protein